MVTGIPNLLHTWSPKLNRIKLWERNTGKKILNHGELYEIKTNLVGSELGDKKELKYSIELFDLTTKVLSMRRTRGTQSS